MRREQHPRPRVRQSRHQPPRRPDGTVAAAAAPVPACRVAGSQPGSRPGPYTLDPTSWTLDPGPWILDPGGQVTAASSLAAARASIVPQGGWILTWIPVWTPDPRSWQRRVHPPSCVHTGLDGRGLRLRRAAVWPRVGGWVGRRVTGWLACGQQMWPSLLQPQRCR